MEKRYILAAALFVLAVVLVPFGCASPGQGQQESAPAAEPAITADTPDSAPMAEDPSVQSLEEMSKVNVDNIVEHIKFLSSPALEGRMSTGKGGKKAAEYIAGLFQEYGLVPANDDASYYHRFFITLTEPDNTMLWTLKGTTDDSSITHFKYGTDFLPFNFSAPTSPLAEGGFYKDVVFAGYGITAPEFAYDDYAELDSEGKVVIVLSGEPLCESEDFFGGVKDTDYSDYDYKAVNAAVHGAAGILVVNCVSCAEPCPPESYYTVWPGYIPEKEKIRMKETPQPTYLTQEFRVISLQSRTNPKNRNFTIPALLVSRNVAETLMSVESLSEIKESIDNSHLPKSFAPENVMVNMDISFKMEKKEDQNVVGFIEGTDSAMKYQVVIIGAHYDHLGTNSAGEFYPGANDNASGTASLLELARILSMPANRPKRSILMVAFGGEEIGLWGSSAYASSITGKISPVAMLNMDMLGSGHEQDCYVIGVLRNPELFDIVKQANETVEISVRSNIEFAFKFGSDHWPFHVIGIPALDFTSSRFKKYHSPQDTIDEVNIDKVRGIAELVIGTAKAITSSNISFPEPKDVEVPYPSHGGGGEKKPFGK